jgi:hypothetical protein
VPRGVAATVNEQGKAQIDTLPHEGHEIGDRFRQATRVLARELMG